MGCDGTAMVSRHCHGMTCLCVIAMGLSRNFHGFMEMPWNGPESAMGFHARPSDIMGLPFGCHGFIAMAWNCLGMQWNCHGMPWDCHSVKAEPWDDVSSWHCRWIAMGSAWDCHGSVTSSCDYHAVTMAVPWDCRETSLRLSLDRHGTP